MTPATPPQLPDPETLTQMSTKHLVVIILEKHWVIEQLTEEVNRLKTSQNVDSKTSSKPPSTDLLKKPEKTKEQPVNAEAETKRKPGGQPGHEGRTRKGFGRVDRYEILRSQECPHCGSVAFVEQPMAVQRQQVAQLVERPIEVVEYHRLTCRCADCGEDHIAP